MNPTKRSIVSVPNIFMIILQIQSTYTHSHVIQFPLDVGVQDGLVPLAATPKHWQKAQKKDSGRVSATGYTNTIG